MQIDALSRWLAQDFTCDEPWAVISIRAKASDTDVVFHTENRIAVLRMNFIDLDNFDCVDRGITSSNEMFSKDMADAILNFYISIKDKVKVLIIHCEAGVSRSPAVASALGLIFHGNDGGWWQKQLPNKLVFQTLLMEAKNRGLWEPKMVNWDDMMATFNHPKINVSGYDGCNLF